MLLEVKNNLLQYNKMYNYLKCILLLNIVTFTQSISKCLKFWLHNLKGKVEYLRTKHAYITLVFEAAAAAAAKSLQSCLTLCDPIDGSPPGSPVPGILQARILEWVAISFSNAWKWKVKVKLLSHVWLLVTPWTAAYQAPPSMGFFQARVLEWGAIAFS